MPKNLLQDIVKVKHFSPPPLVREIEIRKKDIPPERLERMRPKKESHRTRYALWGVAIIAVIFFLFALSYFFLKVVVTVNPKINEVVLNENLSAVKDGSGEAVPFDLIVISGEEDKTVQTAEEKDVTEKAQGVVLIYNAFGSASQLLSIDTRLEGSNGKIYKTKKALVVPGMKGSIPGSVEVGIYGAEAGEEYNSIPLDFTIFGFKGTSKYSKFYARSKGPIIGGFKGKSPSISDEQKASVLSELKTTLQTKLFKKATNQIPSGFVLFKDAVFLNIDDNSTQLVSSGNKTASMKEKGTLYGILFDENKLAKKIAQDSIKNYDGAPVYVSNIQDLAFSLADKDTISFGNVKNINFSLKGNAKIVWKVDENKFKTDLLGKSKKDFSQILLQYPNIDSADLAISPFWKMTLPDKSKDIKVIVNYPK